MIYFAQIDIPNGPVKIGYAKNPEKRVKKLQQHKMGRIGSWVFRASTRATCGHSERNAPDRVEKWFILARHALRNGAETRL